MNSANSFHLGPWSGRSWWSQAVLVPAPTLALRVWQESQAFSWGDENVLDLLVMVAQSVNVLMTTRQYTLKGDRSRDRKWISGCELGEEVERLLDGLGSSFFPLSQTLLKKRQ